MTAEGGAFAQGGAQFPLTSALTHSLLEDADPALFKTLAYFQSVLTTHLNARFLAECARAPAILGPTGAPFGSIVTLAIPYDPAPYLTQFQASFPLLAVYRSKSAFKWKTHSFMDTVGAWFVEYILPPITAGQAERIAPIFRAVAIVIQNRIENMFDPGFEGGAEVWKEAGIEEISLDEDSYGVMPASGNLVFPSWMGKLTVKELDSPVFSQYEALTGLDTQIDADSPNDPPVENFIDQEIDFGDPTSIANVAGFYRGDAGLTYPTDGYHVSGWADQSAAAANLAGVTNAQPIERPQAFLVEDQNKLVPKSSVRFDGATSSLTTTSSSLNVDTGCTLVVLSRLYNTSARQSLILRTASGDVAGAHTLGPEANTASSAGGLFGVFAGGSSYDTETATDQKWHVHIVRVTGTANATPIAGSLSYRIDGAEQTLTKKSGSGNWQGMTAATEIALGGNPADMADTALTGDVAIAAAFARRLTDAECSAVENYCRLWTGMPPT